MAWSEEMMPGQRGFHSWAAWRAGMPGILGHPGSWRQVSLHIHHLQLVAGGDPEASGSLGNVMVTAWEESHLHFLMDWLLCRPLVEDAVEAGRLACWGPLEEN